MKILLRTLTTVMLFAMVAIATAKEPLPAFKFEIVDANSFVLYLNNQGGTNVKVSIKDQRNTVLYADELIAEIGAAKKYNMSNLPFGSYIVEIENELAITEHEISLTREGLAITKENVNYFPKPLIVENGPYADLMFSDIESGPVKVKFFSPDASIIFSETLKSDDLIQRRYNLSQLAAGSYRMTVSANGKLFSKSFRVE
ncbi:MAG: hypothetical protein KDE26_18280 [Bacteroidetes bacterium]|nr:hypothetical protein [Bacteroidota bacterium]MCB0845206.1 hypothetical protein [Bacteroidota bacterium]